MAVGSSMAISTLPLPPRTFRDHTGQRPLRTVSAHVPAPVRHVTTMRFPTMRPDTPDAMAGNSMSAASITIMTIIPIFFMLFTSH